MNLLKPAPTHDAMYLVSFRRLSNMFSHSSKAESFGTKVSGDGPFKEACGCKGSSVGSAFDGGEYSGEYVAGSSHSNSNATGDGCDIHGGCKAVE
jgi:hypothetical protein